MTNDACNPVGRSSVSNSSDNTGRSAMAPVCMMSRPKADKGTTMEKNRTTMKATNPTSNGPAATSSTTNKRNHVKKR